jgi:hypothetical protein
VARAEELVTGARVPRIGPYSPAVRGLLFSIDAIAVAEAPPLQIS